MSMKKVPLRQCIGCGEMKSKREMIRVIKTPENEINTTYELFKKLREIQTKTSDAEAFSRYGIPQDKIDSNQSLTVAQDKFKEETEEYTKQKAHLDKNA